jgi:hypothetical protein
MNYAQSAMLAALERAEICVRDNAHLLGGLAASPVMARVSAAIAELHAQAQRQLNARTHSEAGTANIARLRERLRYTHLAPIAAVGHASRDEAVRMRCGAFRLPHPRASDHELLTAARVIANIAHDVREPFIRAGLPATFVEDLHGAIDALDREREERYGAQLARSGATMSLSEWHRRARLELDVADAFVKAAAGNNGGLMAQWRSAIRIPAKPGVRRVRVKREAMAEATLEVRTEVPAEAPARPMLLLTAGTPPFLALPVPSRERETIERDSAA